jgi:hypothetical protein
MGSSEILLAERLGQSNAGSAHCPTPHFTHKRLRRNEMWQSAHPGYSAAPALARQSPFAIAAHVVLRQSYTFDRKCWAGATPPKWVPYRP